MSTEIELVRWSVSDLEVMADRVAKSKLFGLDQSQAFTLMLLCQAEGIHPVKAVQRYHVIQGRPAMKADAMLADFLRIGGTVEWVTQSDDREKCEAIFTHPAFAKNGQAVRFTTADAKAAGLLGNPTWQKYPSNMLRARVISNGVRMIAPGIVAGLYTPEEVQDIVQDEPKPHHAVNHDNETGHGVGAYAAPEVVKEYQDWITKTCEDVNSKWLDDLTGKFGEIPDKAPAEVISTWQLSGHLLKWGRGKGLVNAPDDTRAGQRDKFAAVLWLVAQRETMDEAREYCRKLWRQARGKVKPPREPGCDDGPDIDEAMDKLAEEGAVA